MEIFTSPIIRIETWRFQAAKSRKVFRTENFLNKHLTVWYSRQTVLYLAHLHNSRAGWSRQHINIIFGGIMPYMSLQYCYNKNWSWILKRFVHWIIAGCWSLAINTSLSILLILLARKINYGISILFWEFKRVFVFIFLLWEGFIIKP